MTFPLRTARRLGGKASLVAIVALGAWNCAGPPPAEDSAPPFLLGEFVDDYGIRYTIQRDEWVQHPNARYHIRTWQSSARFVVAQNDSSNRGDGGLWTRIDWVVLDDSGEYEWAFCYAAYQAPTRQDAVLAASTQRDTPRTGCNGFPFSRMKRVTPSEP